MSKNALTSGVFLPWRSTAVKTIVASPSSSSSSKLWLWRLAIDGVLVLCVSPPIPCASIPSSERRRRQSIDEIVTFRSMSRTLDLVLFWPSIVSPQLLLFGFWSASTYEGGRSAASGKQRRRNSQPYAADRRSKDLVCKWFSVEDFSVYLFWRLFPIWLPREFLETIAAICCIQYCSKCACITFFPFHEKIASSGRRRRNSAVSVQGICGKDWCDCDDWRGCVGILWWSLCDIWCSWIFL